MHVGHGTGRTTAEVPVMQEEATEKWSRAVAGGVPTQLYSTVPLYGLPTSEVLRFPC
jgi:hypothetical protein